MEILNDDEVAATSGGYIPGQAEANKSVNDFLWNLLLHPLTPTSTVVGVDV